MAKSRNRKKQKGNRSVKTASPSLGNKKAPITPASFKKMEQLYAQAVALYDAGQLDEAEKICLTLVDIYPGHLPALLALSKISLDINHLSSALSYARRAVEADHSASEAHRQLGYVLSRGGMADLAESELTIALQLDNQNHQILSNLGYVYTQQGRFEEAHELFRRAIALKPDYIRSYRNLAVSKHFTREDEDFNLIASLADRLDSSNEQEQILIHFTLGKVFHDCGEYDRAFREYQQGNDLKAKQVSYDPDANEKHVESIINTLDESWMEQLPAGGNPFEGPVFIVGMPRSGTTLLETLLCRHPQITGIGEAKYIDKLATICGHRFHKDQQFPEVVRELTAGDYREMGDDYIQWSHEYGVTTQYTVDKLPANFIYLGFILAILPNAKLIHNYRDPVDNCLSIYQALFARENIEYSYDLKHIAHYFLLYRKIMAHWKKIFPEKILDVNYGDVVADPEQQLRRVIDFCGLPWDDNCLDEDQKKHVTPTASVWQARQPVYKSSVKRWRKYEKHLGPLLEALSPVLDENGEPLSLQY